MQRILSCSNRTILIERVVHPFGLTIYKHKLYWTDWVLGSVNVANKKTGTNLRSFVQNIDGVIDLHAHAGSAQLETGKGWTGVRHTWEGWPSNTCYPVVVYIIQWSLVLMRCQVMTVYMIVPLGAFNSSWTSRIPLQCCVACFCNDTLPDTLSNSNFFFSVRILWINQITYWTQFNWQAW